MKVKIDGTDLNECKKTYKTINVNLKETQICAGRVDPKDSPLKPEMPKGQKLVLMENDLFVIRH